MSNNQDSKTTFWQFLSQYCIEIPIIQRDYAQGRAGREFLRRNFLRDIREALDSKQELLLDFVYGSVRGECFLPLDGQQRLTTLWLIHWYIAFRSGKLGEAAETLGKFSYETRLSSREFCKKLCTDMDLQSFIDSETESLKDYIPSQKWFYSLWRQDPTIDAMLRMISGTDIKDKGGEDIMDGIEELFCGTTKDEFVRYWDLLTQPNAPIVFYNRPLESLGLTDDLYIKMNARGKQLTPFENFKADLIGYLQHQKDQAHCDDPESASKWEKLLDAQSGIPILMDTSWTELFWQYKSEDCHIDEIGQKKPEECHIDEIYLAFINRFFWNELFYESLNDGIDIEEIEQSRSYRYLNADIVDDYVGLAPYCLRDGNKDIPIPQELFFRLKSVLENFIRWSNGGKKKIEYPKWNKSFSFIPKYNKNGDDGKKRVITLNQVERIVFFALCKYFLKDEADDVSLARWMRVVWNLISERGLDNASEIRSIPAMRTAMSFINQLDSHRVYESLCKQDPKENPTAFECRWNEEIAKAKQILDESGDLRMHRSGRSWEDVIKKAEEYAFFNGAIRFLFQDEKGEVSWDDFDTKWSNAQNFFRDGGTYDKEDPQLLQALFSRFDTRAFSEVLFWKFQVFNNEPWTWRYFLLNKEIYAPIHELLMGETNIIQTEKPEIENSPTGQEPYEYNVKVVLYQLTQTSLLEFILKQDDAKKYWIRTVNGYYYCYPKYGRDGILLNALDRDNFLRDDEVEVNKDFIFPRKELFSLVNMPFTFKEHHYFWCSDNKIYLMRDDNPEEYLLTGAETEESSQVFLEYKEYKGKPIGDLKKELSKLAQKHLTAKSE